MSSPAAGHFQITPTLELEDVFLCLEARLVHLPTPRSLVEAQFTRAEIDGLRDWLLARWEFEVAIWCEDRLRLEKAANANRQEMIGALVLILACAQCREHADEEAVWPAVTRAFKGCKGYPALFCGRTANGRFQEGDGGRGSAAGPAEFD